MKSGRLQRLSVWGRDSGVRSRFVPDINGLRVHILEAGDAGRPCVLLLHGFPELAYSWRKVMPALAEAHIADTDMAGPWKSFSFISCEMTVDGSMLTQRFTRTRSGASW